MMSQVLETFFDDIKASLTTIVQPSRITKNVNTCFEIWSSHYSSSIFFCSISLHPDYVSIKFSPHLPEECLNFIKPFSRNTNWEFFIVENDINPTISTNIKDAISKLHQYYIDHQQ